ncbi:precorrin-3B synthase [Paracoccus indicus]|uniref:precorrin-3B synthase n=1 Tax=Paracoccus indicus TaxID=2079229 RepID=UPI000D3ABCA0|nr:precorrin-3B synthase [Paracoccus indicus]
MIGVKGWCPGALRPMQSGDGLVVRIKPRGAMLSREQAAGIADAAETHGNGLIDLTGRGNLQLRGVTPATHAPLIADLRALDLIDPDIVTETRRNIIVTPFGGDATDALVRDLEAALAASALPLPAKFGFAVDTGSVPVLTHDPADIRIECSGQGLILRADGMAKGTAFGTPSDAVGLAQWFLEQGGAPDGRGRMAALIAGGITPRADLAPNDPAPRAQPASLSQGVLVGFEFGQVPPGTLRRLGRLGPLRLTPWRMLLVQGARHLPPMPGLILDAGDPRLRVRACTGAPGCTQSHAATRPLARDLSPLMAPDAVLHVSGCAKGCGWPRAADITLTATPWGFDLIRYGCAHDAPALRGLHPDQLPKVL